MVATTTVIVPVPAVAALGAAVPSVAVTVAVMDALAGAPVVMLTTPVVELIATHPKPKVVESRA